MLIKNTTVVTMDGDNRILKEVDVLVKDGRIAEMARTCRQAMTLVKGSSLERARF